MRASLVTRIADSTQLERLLRGGLPPVGARSVFTMHDFMAPATWTSFSPARLRGCASRRVRSSQPPKLEARSLPRRTLAGRFLGGHGEPCAKPPAVPVSEWRNTGCGLDGQSV